MARSRGSLGILVKPSPPAILDKLVLVWIDCLHHRLQRCVRFGAGHCNVYLVLRRGLVFVWIACLHHRFQGRVRAGAGHCNVYLVLQRGVDDSWQILSAFSRQSRDELSSRTRIGHNMPRRCHLSAAAGIHRSPSTPLVQETKVQFQAY